MSFRMTGNITVGPFKPFTCSTANWHRHVDNYADSATFTIPAFCKLKTNSPADYNSKAVPTGLQFTEGMPVTMALGYDDINITRFKGFIKRINFKVPLEVECEGYSYLLRKVIFTKTYAAKTTAKQILKDLLTLIPNNPIVLSDNMPDVIVEPFPFQNYPGTKVLEFLKERYYLAVFFHYNVLYAGIREVLWNNASNNTVKHKLGWNIIKDDQLLFNAYKEFATVNIQMVSINTDGTRNKALNKLLTPGNIKKLRTLAKDLGLLKQLAKEQKIMYNNKGYTGSITGFLMPYVEPGMSDDIGDDTYPERKGNYFVEGVQGSFSHAGGRQIIKIGNSL